MSIKQGSGLPNDAIRFRMGYEGTEPQEIEDRIRAFPVGYQRCAVVINTFYPSLPGGYYFNRGVLELIGQSLRTLGLFFVWKEIYSPDESLAIPSESASTLELNENYVVVDEHHRICGEAFVWEYSVGGGGAFYSDDIIVDLILEDKAIQRFVAGLQELCTASGVEFTMH